MSARHTKTSRITRSRLRPRPRPRTRAPQRAHEDHATSPAERIRLASALVRPLNRAQLRAYVRHVLGFTLPRRALTAGHDAPLEYLAHAFFEETNRPRDCIIWANRGGGKTQLGAIATLLDLVFKPGIQIRILGGSFDQSSKMHQYLRRLFRARPFADLLLRPPTERGIELVNGARVEVLTQSERSVRGQRVHKLRCDEVELFDPEVWEAAQLVTRSGRCGDTLIHGSIEVFSTMHRHDGLMRRLVEEAEKTAARRIFRWNVLDVLERCPPERECTRCPLWSDCRGGAKGTEGFFSIDDALAQQRRVGRAAWESEMLGARPDARDLVYPEFDPAVHVESDEAWMRAGADARWVAGIDFGYRAPTAIIWGALDEAGVLHVVDEHVEATWIAERHIAAARAKPWPHPLWFGADPAGEAANDQTGVSTAHLWRSAGFRLRTRRVGVNDGLRLVRARLRRADGCVALKVHARCTRLIAAIQRYHYPPAPSRGEGLIEPGDLDRIVPVKDGSDHIMDALRYLVVNLDRATSSRASMQWYA